MGCGKRWDWEEVVSEEIESEDEEDGTDVEGEVGHGDCF